MHTHVSTDTEAASYASHIMCIKHVPKLTRLRSAHEECYGRVPKARAAPVSSFQLLVGFEVQLVEAHGADIHHGEDVGAASRPPSGHTR